MGLPLELVSRFRLGDVDLVGDRVDPRSFKLGLDSMGEQRIARRVPNVDHSLFRVARCLDASDVSLGDDLLHERSVRRRQVGQPNDIDLVDDEEGGLVGEQRLDRVEQLALIWTKTKQRVSFRTRRRTGC